MSVSLNGQRGTAAVEVALVAPFLILLMLGIVEFSWVLAQDIDVRHGAREAGRLAGTNFGDTNAIVTATCNRIEDDAAATVSLSGSTGVLGDHVQATVSRPASTITGFIDWALPPGLLLSSASEFRLEESPPAWSDVVDQPCP